MSPPDSAPASSSTVAPSRLRSQLDQLNRGVLRVIDRITPSEQQRVFGVTLAVGAICGLVAVSFHEAIRFGEVHIVDRIFAAPGYTWIPWILGVPTLGGLVSGALLVRFPRARGSGIPQVKSAFAIKTTQLRMRDSIAKFGISAIQIGTGSAHGREGPTVQICATVASGVGRLFALSPSNQRRLIPVGAAAGIAAAFNAPIAAVTFVIEELVGALDTTVLSGVVIAAAIAAVVEHGVLGEHPVFSVPTSYGLGHPSSLLIYAALGLAAGGLGHGFVKGLLTLRKKIALQRYVPVFAQPAIGGLVTGVLATLCLIAVQTRGVTGGGYATLNQALAGQLGLEVMALLCIAKFAATVTCYSSGGAGGIFAPALFVGGMLGGLFGFLDGHLLGHDDVQIGAFALVGMGAFFAAVIRAPITSVLIIFEMTGSYRLVLPLMIANTVAFLLARQSQATPIYEALLEQDNIVLPHARTSPLMASVHIRDAMTKKVFCLDPNSTVAEALGLMKELPYVSFPVVDAEGRFHGVLTEGRLRRLEADGLEATQLRSHVRLREYLHSGHTIRDALDVMNRLGVRQMAVVDEEDRGKLAGILSMSDVMRALLVAEAPPDSVLATPPPIPMSPPSSPATPPPPRT